MRSKKGSLELSINAIVIIVLAFVLLGLGLGFIRKQFSGMTDTSSQVQEQVKQGILEDLRTGDKKLSFSTQRVTLDKGGQRDLAVGIKNTKAQGEMKFYLDVYVSQDEANSVKCKKNIDLTQLSAPIDSLKTVTCEGADSSILDANGAIKNIQFFFDPGFYTLGSTDAEVYPISVKETGKQSNTYMVKMVAWECGTTCDEILTTPYAEKSFFVQVG